MLHPSNSHDCVTGDSHSVGIEHERWHDGEHPDRVVADVARQPRLPCHVVTLANEKGGVGKSTLAFQITVTLAARGYQVVAVDCDRNQQSLGRTLLNRDASTPARHSLREPGACGSPANIGGAPRPGDSGSTAMPISS